MKRLNLHLKKGSEALAALEAANAPAREIATLRNIISGMHEITTRWTEILKSEKQ